MVKQNANWAKHEQRKKLLNKNDKLFVASIAAYFCLLIGVHLYAASPPSPTKKGLSITWKWEVRSHIDGEKTLAVTFDDGRKYLFAANHMSGVRFFPKGHAATIENNAELYITCGSVTTRLDVVDDDGMALVNDFVKGGLIKTIPKDEEE